VRHALKHYKQRNMNYSYGKSPKKILTIRLMAKEDVWDIFSDCSKNPGSAP